MSETFYQPSIAKANLDEFQSITNNFTEFPSLYHSHVRAVDAVTDYDDGLNDRYSKEEQEIECFGHYLNEFQVDIDFMSYRADAVYVAYLKSVPFSTFEKVLFDIIVDQMNYGHSPLLESLVRTDTLIKDSTNPVLDIFKDQYDTVLTAFSETAPTHMLSRSSSFDVPDDIEELLLIVHALARALYDHTKDNVGLIDYLTWSAMEPDSNDRDVYESAMHFLATNGVFALVNGDGSTTFFNKKLFILTNQEVIE